jgi:hypothetical protein
MRLFSGRKYAKMPHLGADPYHRSECIVLVEAGTLKARWTYAPVVPLILRWGRLSEVAPRIIGSLSVLMVNIVFWRATQNKHPDYEVDNVLFVANGDAPVTVRTRKSSDLSGVSFVPPLPFLLSAKVRTRSFAPIKRSRDWVIVKALAEVGLIWQGAFNHLRPPYRIDGQRRRPVLQDRRRLVGYTLAAVASTLLLPRRAKSQCVTDTPSVDACWGGVRITAPPGVTLDLSFMVPGSMPAGVTFTRASTATYFDSTGTLQTAATNAPRWDYDPVTHALRGLLIEEARTNIALNSGDMSNATWTKEASVVAAPVVTANQITAPDGTLTAARIVFPAVSVASNYSVVYNIMTVTAVVYTFSVWLRGAAGGEQTYLYIPTTASRLRVTLTTAWQRFVVTSASALPAGSGYVQIGTDLRDGGQASTSAQTIYVWGAQFEAGAIPTSYVPTTAASVTRAADTATMPTAAWFNASTSTLSADFMVAQSPNPSAALVRDACALSDGTASNRLMLRAQVVSAATAVFGTSIAATTTASASLGATTANAVAKIAAAWNGTTGTGSLNGAATVSYAVGMPAGLTTLAIGNDYSGATAYLNGWVRRVRYWPRALSNAELQQVTT